jgi:integrase
MKMHNLSLNSGTAVLEPPSPSPVFQPLSSVLPPSPVVSQEKIKAISLLLADAHPSLTPAQLALALERVTAMRAILPPHLPPWARKEGGCELESLVRRVRELHHQCPVPTLLGDAITAFKLKKGDDLSRSEKTTEYYELLDRFHRAAGCIFAENAEPIKWLEQLQKEGTITERTRRIYQVFFRSFFQWCVTKNFCPFNPCPAYVGNQRRGGSRIAIIPPSDVLRLLETAIWWRPHLIPILVLQFFGGLRPSRETFELVWDDLTLTGGAFLQLDRSTVKTRITRRVELTPALVAWLELFAGRPGQEKVCAISYDNWKERRRNLYRLAGVSWTGANAPRHSTESALINARQNRLLAAANAGHSQAVQLSTYVRHLPPGAGNRHLNIFPPEGYVPNRDFNPRKFKGHTRMPPTGLVMISEPSAEQWANFRNQALPELDLLLR